MWRTASPAPRDLAQPASNPAPPSETTLPYIPNFSRSLKDLSAHDAASRMSSHLYGNILVLAAIIFIDPKYVENGHALMVVVGTGVTTLLAHIVAESQEHRVLDDGEGTWTDFVHALRNSIPIVTSSIVPAILLSLGYWGAVSTELAWHFAVVSIIIRMLFTGVVIARYRGEKVTLKTMMSGLILAIICLLIAQTKAHVTH